MCTIYAIYPIDYVFRFFSGRSRQRSQWEAKDINVPMPILSGMVEGGEEGREDFARDDALQFFSKARVAMKCFQIVLCITQ